MHATSKDTTTNLPARSCVIIPITILLGCVAARAVEPVPLLVATVATTTLDAGGRPWANDNGIADAWEKMFGITDPHGDGDGNLDEYLAGTDPLAPNSKPVASDLTSVRLAIRNPDASATPGTWFDPVSWIRITDPLEISVSERIYHYPAASAGRQRFFRLHQQP